MTIKFHSENFYDQSKQHEDNFKVEIKDYAKSRGDIEGENFFLSSSRNEFISLDNLNLNKWLFYIFAKFFNENSWKNSKSKWENYLDQDITEFSVIPLLEDYKLCHHSSFGYSNNSRIGGISPRKNSLYFFDPQELYFITNNEYAIVQINCKTLQFFQIFFTFLKEENVNLEPYFYLDEFNKDPLKYVLNHKKSHKLRKKQLLNTTVIFNLLFHHIDIDSVKNNEFKMDLNLIQNEILCEVYEDLNDLFFSLAAQNFSIPLHYSTLLDDSCLTELTFNIYKTGLNNGFLVEVMGVVGSSDISETSPDCIKVLKLLYFDYLQYQKNLMVKILKLNCPDLQYTYHHEGLLIHRTSANLNNYQWKDFTQNLRRETLKILSKNNSTIKLSHLDTFVKFCDKDSLRQFSDFFVKNQKTAGQEILHLDQLNNISEELEKKFNNISFESDRLEHYKTLTSEYENKVFDLLFLKALDESLFCDISVFDKNLLNQLRK